MADHDATRELFRELLGMTGGANASGRGQMYIPDDIMDSLSGDAAQDALAQERLIMEMRNQDLRKHDPRFVSLDLMEMEAHHVDDFLGKARKKIMKRSKPTRKACCSKIGGVLDQMMGLLGGDYADQKAPNDRGQEDPIGEDVLDEALSDEHKKVYAFRKEPPEARAKRIAHFKKTGEILGEGVEESSDIDLISFIAEEFFPWEHDTDCALSDPDFALDENELPGVLRVKHRGLLREHFHLTEGEGIPLAKAKMAYKILMQKKAAGQLAGKEAALLPKLKEYIKMKSGESAGKQEEDYTMEPSNTAKALSSFMESSQQAYKSAHSGSGKGKPDSLAGGLGAKRDSEYDNDEYDTQPVPVKSGGSKVAGKPYSPGTRDVKPGDPIGESEDPRVAAHRALSKKMGMASGRMVNLNPAQASWGPTPEHHPMHPKHPLNRLWQAAGGSKPSPTSPPLREGSESDGNPLNDVSPAETWKAGPRKDKVLGKRQPGGKDWHPSATNWDHTQWQQRRGGEGNGAPAPVKDDVDYDGPQISETAGALANFMESVITAKTLRAAYSGDAVESKAKEAGTPGYGKPLVPAKGVRKGKARFDKPSPSELPGEANDKGYGKNKI